MSTSSVPWTSSSPSAAFVIGLPLSVEGRRCVSFPKPSRGGRRFAAPDAGGMFGRVVAPLDSPARGHRPMPLLRRLRTAVGVFRERGAGGVFDVWRETLDDSWWMGKL